MCSFSCCAQFSRLRGVVNGYEDAAGGEPDQTHDESQEKTQAYPDEPAWESSEVAQAKEQRLGEHARAGAPKKGSEVVPIDTPEHDRFPGAVEERETRYAGREGQGVRKPGEDLRQEAEIGPAPSCPQAKRAGAQPRGSRGPKDVCRGNAPRG